MLNKTITDITYQNIEFDTEEESQQVSDESRKLLNNGWQPYFAPVFGSYESMFKVHYGLYQTWVKYE